MIVPRIALPAVLLAILSCACGETAKPPVPNGPSPASQMQAERARATVELARLERQRLAWREDRALFADAAKTAWTFVSRPPHSATGLISPLETYHFATIWDVGSMLAALYSARGLGLIDDEAYDQRVDRILATLGRVSLYGGNVFNKSYDTRTGAMVDHPGPHSGGTGWSATDFGRLLIWLRIVGADGRHEAAANAVVQRNDSSRMVASGYLWGQDPDRSGKPQTYQEGKIGYEQYAATGFALWGQRAEHALALEKNALPISVMDQPLMADYRRRDRLTSDPILLLGLEVGWDPRMARLARRLLLAQEARYERTGTITIVGEDAIDQPPHHFYYYSVYTDGKAFGIDVQDRQAVVDGPRWVSAKSALAFHALMPSRYTRLALDRLRLAQHRHGWASGIYETGETSTGTVNLNTAAVILEAALFQLHGMPLLDLARTHGR